MTLKINVIGYKTVANGISDPDSDASSILKLKKAASPGTGFDKKNKILMTSILKLNKSISFAIRFFTLSSLDI